MKKLNKKGVTLIELIVSFAIVSVAMIYFYQSIVDLHRIYKNSNNATDKFVKKTYALRVLDAHVNKNGVNNLSKLCSDYSMFCTDGKTNFDTSDTNYQKVTLSDGKITVVYYRGLASIYEKNLITAGVINNSGNVSSFDDIEKFAKKEGNIVTVEINSDNKLIYTIKDNEGNEKYKKTNTNTIKEIIEEDGVKKTRDEIVQKVKRLVGDTYIINTVPGGGKIIYYVTDPSGLVVAENIYTAEDSDNLCSNESLSFKNECNNKYSFDSAGYTIKYNTGTEKYDLEYIVDTDINLGSETISQNNSCVVRYYDEDAHRVESYFAKDKSKKSDHELGNKMDITGNNGSYNVTIKDYTCSNIDECVEQIKLVNKSGGNCSIKLVRVTESSE